MTELADCKDLFALLVFSTIWAFVLLPVIYILVKEYLIDKRIIEKDNMIDVYEYHEGPGPSPGRKFTIIEKRVFCFVFLLCWAYILFFELKVIEIYRSYFFDFHCLTK